MPANYSCINCGKLFERSRPDQNSQKMCSVRCRWEHYTEVPADVEACWEWVGTVANNGYGVLRVSGKVETAHRLALKLDGLDVRNAHVLHSCDNRSCVNPIHLRLGTARDNVDDTMKRGRHAWNRWTDTEKQDWIQKVLAGQQRK